MADWRDRILREFTPDVARLTLVADPDGLLLEEGVLAGILERGFELIPFEDHIAFRYAYESRFRSRWDRGGQTGSAVVLRCADYGLDSLPYDLLQAGRPMSFNLGEIFPDLSYSVLAELHRAGLDALHEAQRRHTPGVLGDNATKEFILRHVFEIDPELIGKSSDLLRVLLRRHYREQRIPALLDEHLIRLLQRRDDFKDWPLETIVPDREAFFAFLQERWPVFLDREAGSGGPGEQEKSRDFEFPGPLDLPFDHDDVRVYVNDLFLEGFLQAVPHEQAESFSKTWRAWGIRTDEQADRKRRVDRLMDSMGATASAVPQEDARHEEWLRFARTWAELFSLALELDTDVTETAQWEIEGLQNRIDDALLTWLTKRYSGLINLPPVPPVMLHHVPRFLSRRINDGKEHKAALVVVDGLSLHQWFVIRKVLARQHANYRFRDNEVFAWIPTITTVSRQAAFAGKPPLYFPNSIHTTEKEPTLWKQFWMDQGLTQQEIAYAKGLGDGPLVSVEELVARPKMRVLGLVVDKVDRIMHGMQLGAAGMHNQVRQWAAQPFMANLVDLLLEHGFRVCLTSDHGNIEAAGKGRPSEGAVADVRGERARVYTDSSLRGQVKERFPDALEWPPTGLPQGYLPLLAPGRSAFVGKQRRVVGHGGASLEELIVPLVQIESRDG